MGKALIEQLTDSAIADVNSIINAQICSPVALVNEICSYLIIGGGKRFRPRLLLLVAGMINPDAINDENMKQQAAVIELIHTATLLHDDVIDESEMRRGMPTVNKTYSNTLAILGGDYLFTRAFFLSSDNKSVGRLFTKAISVLVEGEIEQLANIADTKLSEERYFHTIYAKTGILFECATTIPALLLNCNTEQLDALQVFGQAIGNAFQIADDILDYTASSAELGKNIGDDLAEQKITLPLIYAFHSLDPQDQQSLQDAISQNDINAVLNLVHKTDAISRCQARAQLEIDNAIKKLELFPASPYRDALAQLAQKTLSRQH